MYETFLGRNWMGLGCHLTTALTPVDHEGEPRVDARGLHTALGTKTKYTQWMRERIGDYGFEEGADFIRIFGKTGGRPRMDYLITVNMAKELAMVERSPIGRIIRRYFIQMEQSAIKMASDIRDHGAATERLSN